MERKKFLQKGLTALGVAFVAPLANGCSKGDSISSEDGTGNCATTPTETEGPYPTKSPSSLVQSDIRGDRTGVTLTVKITVNNKNSNCAALPNAIVDIWHCDALGAYSEYSSGYTASHWLRGRQTTDANGLVTFTSIFPGWYPGRAPHIHVHIFNASGTSLLITQIAFPTDICNAVYTTASPYSGHGTQDTQNSTDGIFRDSLTSELATVTGSVSAGYTLTHVITVNG
ncbi:MAG: intradiol ring-cleavage dioxygenase [Niabella sp.]